MQLWGPCIDLFCGAGGLSCGFAQAGFDIRVGIDVDASALLTFERNHPQALAIKEDVARLTGDKLRELAGSETVLGMIGGPPCQGFSLAGNHDPDDVRNLLPYEYARLLKEAQPAFFLMENVKGLLSKKQRIHFDAIRDLFSAAGYRLERKLLNAWDYGVAQTRERVFIVGFRSDLEVAFEWPPPDPSRPVLRDAIGDLPDPAEDETALMNHTLSNPRPVSMENRLRNAGKGVAMFDCKVQDWEKQCKTVTAHLSKDVDLAHPGMLPNHAGHLFPNVREESRYDQTKPQGGMGRSFLYDYRAQPFGGAASESRAGAGGSGAHSASGFAGGCGRGYPAGGAGSGHADKDPGAQRTPKSRFVAKTESDHYGECRFLCRGALSSGADPSPAFYGARVRPDTIFPGHIRVLRQLERTVPPGRQRRAAQAGSCAGAANRQRFIHCVKRFVLKRICNP